MTFPFDFPITDLWPERFDPPEVAGGGEMTNMGCYALDYVVTLCGKPQAVAAKWHHFWEPYRAADVENFGQILLDYGDFYALLAVGKQTLGEPRQGSNTLTVQFEHHNFVLDPYTDTLLLNGVARNVVEYLGDYRVESSFDQLLRGIETGAEPESSVRVGADGVEVLMAAYRSIRNGGEWVTLAEGTEGE
jgi:predicted dehydrogenase